MFLTLRKLPQHVAEHFAVCSSAACSSCCSVFEEATGVTCRLDTRQVVGMAQRLTEIQGTERKTCRIKVHAMFSTMKSWGGEQSLQSYSSSLLSALSIP